MKGQVSEERKKVLKRDGPWSFIYLFQKNGFKKGVNLMARGSFTVIFILQLHPASGHEAHHPGVSFGIQCQCALCFWFHNFPPSSKCSQHD